ncbi:hypothetical protein H6P81_009025 [Aristolochia fimbriata]|uniref:Uncharacterized protein n=1 Tax=Aristolochia fimbriata TaxID=158543 RepID=A0AAV7EJN2_ARIFI|nr:hypothetical protein H6P81_009025 [Aristolochia fimbriata]
MGLRDYWNSTSDAIKWTGRSSYSLGGAAIAKLDHAVRVEGLPTVKYYFGDPEGREKIGRCFWLAGTYAAHQSINQVPGAGPILKGFREGLKEDTVSGSKRDNMETLENLTKELNEARKELMETRECYSRLEQEIEEMKRYNQTKMVPKSCNKTLYADALGAQKPEDAIRVFMMNGFIGANLLDALLVPKMVEPLSRPPEV